jgi:hypothetical protein
VSSEVAPPPMLMLRKNHISAPDAHQPMKREREEDERSAALAATAPVTRSDGLGFMVYGLGFRV